MKALIMAAGAGVRLKPFTETTPKVMLTVAGKPLLHHLLLELKKAGITHSIIVVRYLKEKIIDYFSRQNIKNELKMQIDFVEQISENGTGAAVMSAEKYFMSDKKSNEKKDSPDFFLVTAGDSILESKTIINLIKAHKKDIKKNSNQITITLKKVPEPQNYGVAVLDSKNLVTEFVEKSATPPSDLANISLYCMPMSVFSLLNKTSKSERGEYEIVSIFKGARAFITTDYWKDIGYPWDLLDANEELLKKSKEKKSKNQIENSTIKGKIILAKGARIINSYIDEGVHYIGEGSIIGPNAYLRGFNSIGDHCNIGSGSSVKSSILFDHVYAKHLTYIGDSIIGYNVNFGAGTQIANFKFDSKEVFVETDKGFKNSGKRKLGAFVGDHVKFAILSAVMPGKIIGCNSIIHSGVVIDKNIPPKTNVKKKQDLDISKIE